MKGNRGVVDLVALAVVLGLCFAGYQAYRVIAPGRNTKKADQVAVAAANTQAQAVVVDQQAQAVKQAVADATDAHATEIATRDQMDKNATGFSITAKEALKDEDSDAADVARMLIQYSIDALGVQITPQEQQKFIKMALPLIQKNAAMRAQLEQAHLNAVATAASLKAETERRVQAESDAKEAAATLKAQTTTLVKTSTVATKLAKENKAWADDAETWQDRLRAASWLIVTLILLAIGIAVKFLGAKRFSEDMVALQAHTENLAVAAGHDAADLSAKVKDWWQGDKNEARAQAVKANILRQ